MKNRQHLFLNFDYATLRFTNRCKKVKKISKNDRDKNRVTIDSIGHAAQNVWPNSHNLLSKYTIYPNKSSYYELIKDEIEQQNTREKIENLTKPPEWRNAKPTLQAMLYQLALYKSGNLHPFTFNLSPDLIKAAQSNSKGFTDYIRRKLHRNLNIAQKSPQYWFVVELAGTNNGFRYMNGKARPHLHGGIVATDNEISKYGGVRSAFHKTFGKCPPEFKKHVIAFRNHHTYAEKKKKSIQSAVVGWAEYSFKSHIRTRLLFGEDGLTADRHTKAAAKEIYNLIQQNHMFSL